MTPTLPTEVEKVAVKKPYYDLATFERKVKEVEVNFTPAKDVAEILSRMGGDASKLVEAGNSALRRDVIIEGRKDVVLGENEVPVGIVQGFVKNFLPMFAKEATKKAQRAKAIAFVRGSADLMNALKVYSAAVIASGAATEADEDDDDAEETAAK